MPPDILLVEDEPQIQDLISKVLKREGHQVRVSPSLSRARNEVRRLWPDLVILDRRLPDGDGLEFCTRLKKQECGRRLPILFATSKDSVTERVMGLSLGGDDYLTKPFHIEELVARVKALLRRSGKSEPAGPRNLRAHGITLDLKKHQCLIGRRSVGLWPKEFELLQQFLERPGRLLSKEYLSEHVWGHEFFATSRTIETTVQRLRRKLGAKGKFIETVRGYGFKIAEDDRG